jgi:D-psicose/D-tagatose/L-ribulose 3-epimerase
VLTGKAPTEDERSYAAEGLKELCIFAQQYGIDVGLEPANRYETYMINTIGDVLRLIDCIDEKNAGILFDAYHMNIEEKSLYRAVTAAGSRLFHAHASANDRGIPGSGQVHWNDLFRGMKQIAYDRTISIEGFVDNDADVASGACIWRKFASSSEEMAVEGIKFIRSKIEEHGLG